MKKPWIYIIGKVGDLSDDRYYDMVCLKFANRKRELEEQGFVVINPIELVPRHTDWNTAMRICLNGLLQCSHVSPLPDYKESRGGMIEYNLAVRLEYTIIYTSKMNDDVEASIAV